MYPSNLTNIVDIIKCLYRSIVYFLPLKASLGSEIMESYFYQSNVTMCEKEIDVNGKYIYWGTEF